MKRSRVVMLTLAGVSLSVTGCRREPAPQRVREPSILPPESLSPSVRSSLPVFTPGSTVSSEIPPHNAYDARLGYFHAPCGGWYPYPYDHYDSRWGYYRCGKWSRYHSTQAYHSTSSYYRNGYRRGIHPVSGGEMLAPAPHDPATRPDTFTPPADDYARQPTGAPVHSGVAHSDARQRVSSSSSASTTTSRGGFGSTGHSSSFSSSS